MREVSQAELNLYSAIVGKQSGGSDERCRSARPPTSTRLADITSRFAERVKHPTVQVGLATATRRLLEAWSRLTAQRPQPRR